MTQTAAPNRCSHAGCRTTEPCRLEAHADTFTGATVRRAHELRPGDLVVDENGKRKFAAYDVDDFEGVRVWTAHADHLAGWPAVLKFEPTDTFLVVRR